MRDKSLASLETDQKQPRLRAGVSGRRQGYLKRHISLDPTYSDFDARPQRLTSTPLPA